MTVHGGFFEVTGKPQELDRIYDGIASMLTVSALRHSRSRRSGAVHRRAVQMMGEPRGTYYDRLIANSGSLEDAARVDLAIDGNLAYVDLRRRPFAGNPELKSLYRSANLALEELRGALINFAWKEPAP